MKGNYEKDIRIYSRARYYRNGTRLLLFEQACRETKIGAVSAKATYTFNEDNTGSITIIGGVSLNFNYEVEGDQLTVKGNLSGYEGTYTYKVDGDNLSLTQNGTTITLVKNK